MAKHHTPKAKHNKVKKHDSEKEKIDKTENETEFPEEVEKKFKLMLRVLSWVVGTAFVLIVLLPEFNSPLLDKITRVIYLIGISCLLLFVIIEFFADSAKNLLRRILHV